MSRNISATKSRRMTDKNDDPTSTNRIRLVRFTLKKKAECEKPRYSKREKRAEGTLLYLHTCRSLIDSVESAADSFSQMEPCFNHCLDPVDGRHLTDKPASQAHVAVFLIRNVRDRMPTVANFWGSPHEFFGFTESEAESVRGTTPSLKAIQKHLADEVDRRRRQTEVSAQVGPELGITQ
jgi:hypothetical protein